MAHSAKILWVHDDFQGPMNGLAEYKGEKVWFSRTPSLVSSTDIPVEPSAPETRCYLLLRVEPQTLALIEENHVEYCKETGMPLRHGDPHRVERKQQVRKMDYSKVASGFDVSQRVMTKIKQFNHSYEPQNVQGELICLIREDEFENYAVERKIA